jgi:hypothetical protein
MDEIDLSAFKVLIKKIFPPKKCVYTIDLNEDGKEDGLLIRATNVVIPFDIPEEISIKNLSKEKFEDEQFDIGEFLQIYLDDEKIEVSKEAIDREVLKDKFLLVHNGEQFTLGDILDGKLKGRTIGLGDSIDIILRMDEKHFDRLTEGQHKFRIESEIIPSLEVDFKMSKDNFKKEYFLN